MEITVDDGKIDRSSTISKMEIVYKEENNKVKRLIDTYNLDAIIAVGYRINSKKATEFRILATKVLKDYIQKAFTLNDERLGFKQYDEDDTHVYLKMEFNK